MTRILIVVIVILVAALFFFSGSGGTSSIDGDNMMQVFYYGMLLILLAGGVFASRRNWGQAARNLIIWSLIVLALVAAYLYRSDAQEVASRITAGLIPGRAATSTDANGFSTVTLYRGGNGHYAADMTVGDRSISMLVDTGASTIALAYQDAVTLGLGPENLDFSSTVMTANGPARTAYVTLPEVSVGGITRRNVRAGIAERGRLDQSLLGMNFLSTLSSFTFSGDELKLRD